MGPKYLYLQADVRFASTKAGPRSAQPIDCSMPLDNSRYNEYYRLACPGGVP